MITEKQFKDLKKHIEQLDLKISMLMSFIKESNRNPGKTTREEKDKVMQAKILKSFS